MPKTRPGSGNRWSIGPDVRRRTWLASSSRRPRRSEPGSMGRDERSDGLRTEEHAPGEPAPARRARDIGKGNGLVRAGGPTRETYRVMSGITVSHGPGRCLPERDAWRRRFTEATTRDAPRIHAGRLAASPGSCGPSASPG